MPVNRTHNIEGAPAPAPAQKKEKKHVDPKLVAGVALVVLAVLGAVAAVVVTFVFAIPLMPIVLSVSIASAALFVVGGTLLIKDVIDNLKKTNLLNTSSNSPDLCVSNASQPDVPTTHHSLINDNIESEIQGTFSGSIDTMQISLNITFDKDVLNIKTKIGHSANMSLVSSSEDAITYLVAQGSPNLIGCRITFKLEDDGDCVAYLESPDFDEPVKLFKQKK